jgi:hypothetical protein
LPAARCDNINKFIIIVMENTKNINTPASGTTACGCKPPMAPNPETDMTGMYVLANALKANGVEVIFGLVGIPVTEVAYICQMVGIRFISFRFEQQAGMAGRHLRLSY